MPSGGQGPDEARSEGEAMGEYLLKHGIPAGAVLPETRAVNTEQNLHFSREVLRVHKAGPHRAAARGHQRLPRAPHRAAVPVPGGSTRT